MNKYKKAAALLAMVVSLSSCGSQNAKNSDSNEENVSKESEEKVDNEVKEESKEEKTSGTIDDGRFEELATGHNGDIKLAVNIKDSKIESIDILESSETEAITDVAYGQIIDRIIEHQTCNVDNITGATVTSGAVKSAVGKALDQANASEDFKKEVKEEAKEAINIETDILVVGAGGAGLTAALSADEEGNKVTVLEKNAMPGGHTALSGGFALITGSKIQKDVYGVTNDTIESVYNDNMKNGGGESIPEDLKLYAEKMGEATDWTVDYVGSKIPEKLTPLGENSIDRAMIYEGAGAGFVKSLLEKIKDTDIDLRTDTKVNELIYEGDKVVGAKATMSDGTPVEVKAKAVLLATGSYGANKEMLPERLDKFVFYGAQLAQGEGQKMAQELGADVVNQGYVELFENGVEWKPGIAKSTYNGSMAAWDVSGILVDRSGNRVVNERAAGINIVKEMEKQEDARLFLLMDADTYKAFEDNVAGYGITQKMLDDWIATDGQKVPYFAKADTLEELAKKVNIDPAGLEKTVERYNGFVDKQVDEDFGRDATYLKAKISENGPYYIVEQLPRYATTLGGLKIDNQLRVIDKDGKVIDGLFASGDVAGGARGNDSIPGADFGWAVTSGYEAGRTISDYLKE